jgi:probable rRNA maturation factor
MLTLDISRETRAQTPDDASLERAARMALCHGRPEGRQDWELSLRIVDDEEMRELNGRYRGKDGPTNVLSFSAELPDAVDLPLLGDIVICAPVVRSEAQAQGKLPAAHWDHMLIHGILHLLGFDHETDGEAAEMEALETQALQGLGWPCPYTEAPLLVAGEVAR